MSHWLLEVQGGVHPLSLSITPTLGACTKMLPYCNKLECSPQSFTSLPSLIPADTLAYYNMAAIAIVKCFSVGRSKIFCSEGWSLPDWIPSLDSTLVRLLLTMEVTNSDKHSSLR